MHRGQGRAVKGMFLPHCCFPGVMPDCHEASLLPAMEAAGLWTKGQCESPLALLWGPRIPFPEDGLLRLFYFFGSSSELAPASLAAQEGRSPFAQSLLESLESGTSLALCVTPRCPTPVGQGSARTLRCSAKGLFSLPSFPQHVLWLFDQNQRCREGGAMGQEMLKILLLQCKLELWAAQAEGGREQNHL